MAIRSETKDIGGGYQFNYQTVDVGGRSIGIPADLFDTYAEQVRSGADAESAYQNLVSQYSARANSTQSNAAQLSKELGIVSNVSNAKEAIFNLAKTYNPDQATTSQNANSQFVPPPQSTGTQTAQGQTTTMEQRQQGGQLTPQQQQQNQVAEQAYQQRLAQMGGQPTQGASPVPPPSVTSQSYTVQTGDTLSKIASRLGVSVNDISGFRSGNPNLIYPGESLTVKKLAGNAPTGQTPSGGFSMEQIQKQASMTPEQNLQVEQSKSIPPNIKDALVSKGITGDDNIISQVANSSPVKFVTDLYQEIYKNSGLSDIKTQYENFNKQINTITNEMNDKIADVNNNPWLTEGVRQREVKKIQDKYQSRIDSATNSAKYMQSLYDSGLEEARFITQQASTAYNKEIDFQNELYIKALEHGYNMAEAEMALSKPISVGEGNTLYDPTTGKAIFTAPKTFSPNQNGVDGLSSKQYTALNQVTTRFQADPIINLAVKAETAVAIADQIIANPGSATNQLKSLYILVKNLDADSAVREGELALANQTQSYLQQFGNTLARITQGRVVSPQASVDLANATKELVGAWSGTASSRLQQYNSQANTLGIGSEFQSYIGGSGLGFGASGNTTNPLGI